MLSEHLHLILDKAVVSVSHQAFYYILVLPTAGAEVPDALLHHREEKLELRRETDDWTMMGQMVRLS